MTASRESRSVKPSGAEPKPKGHKKQSREDALKAGLYVVATPIGNLGDLSHRAREILSRVDLIAAEDTRVTGKLLSLIGLKRPLLAYNDNNDARRRDQILDRLAEGAAIALVSDAGTPAISDPGYRLIRAAAARGHRIIPIPGPSSVLAALSASGLPSDRFLFLGFLPARSAKRREVLLEFAALRATLVILEAPHRLQECLADLADVLGPREAVIGREMTKLHEEISRGTLVELSRATTTIPKGEIVLVIAPSQDEAQNSDRSDLDSALRLALGQLSFKDAVEAVSLALRMKKRAVYARALELKSKEA